MNIRILNWIVFGALMLVVFASWCATLWTILFIPIVAPAFVLASWMGTINWMGFVKKSLLIQELNRELKEANR